MEKELDALISDTVEATLKASHQNIAKEIKARYQLSKEVLASTQPVGTYADGYLRAIKDFAGLLEIELED